METGMKTNKKFWKPPSFEDFNVAFPKKKIKLDSEEFCEEKTLVIPSEASEPKGTSELSVHSKKIEEVRNWIRWSVKEKAPILLVTGPAGSGKTTTVKVSADEEGILIKEWINPVDKIEFKADPFVQSDVYDRFSFTETKQVDKFEDFVFRSSRYNSLFEEPTKTIILIEDIPNIFLWRPKLFYEFLEKFKFLGKSPIIFILTDDQNLNLSGILFSNNIKIKYGITNIKFNPVNNSCLIKNLKNLVQLYCSEKVSSQFLENICKNSGGDVRSATNDLLLFLRSNLKDIDLLSKKSKISGKKNDELWAQGKPLSEKDSSLDFYHVIGRILYPKLMGEKEKVTCENPNQVFVHDVKKIAEGWNGSFLSILHENYLQTFRKLADVVGGAECFSFCDILGKNEDFEKYSSLVGVITLMLKNKEPKKTGFNPLKKSSQWNSAKIGGSLDAAEELYGCKLSRWDMHMDLIPYLKIIKKSEAHEGKSMEFTIDVHHDEESDEDMIEIEEFEE